jgi:PD-(D/E)XK nuclease superfamily
MGSSLTRRRSDECGVSEEMTLTNYNQSKVKMWRRCQKQFAFRYDYGEDGFELVPRVLKAPLTRGTWLHALIEAHFREEAGQDADWRQVHQQFVDKFNTYFDEEKEDLGDLPTECLRIFKSYLRFYAKDSDRYTTAELSDGSPAIELVLERELPNGENFKGRVDRVVEDREFGGLWIWDHKWVRTVPDTDERMMSPQAPMYVWGLEGYFDEPVRGFLFNYGRTKPPTVPQPLKRGGISQRKNMDTDLHTYVQALKEEYGDDWKKAAKLMYRDTLLRLKERDILWFRRERVPVEQDRIQRCLDEFLLSVDQISSRGDAEGAPRSYFYNCKFGCEYHAPCVGEFTGLNIKPLLKAKYQEVPERYEQTESDLLSA